MAASTQEIVAGPTIRNLTICRQEAVTRPGPRCAAERRAMPGCGARGETLMRQLADFASAE
jgi:hypothetical protein